MPIIHMTRLRIIFLLTMVYCSFPFQAQTNQQLRSQALEAMNHKDWYGASQYFNRLYTRDSSQLKITYRYAEAARLNYEIETAIRLYKRTIALDDNKRFPLAYYWIGQLQKTRGLYPEAKKYFFEFVKKKLSREKYSYYVKRAKAELDICALAELIVANPVIKGLEPVVAVNTKMSEYAPVERDSVLYFSSIRSPEKREQATDQVVNSKIYTLPMQKSKVSKLRALDTTINVPALHQSNTCFSPDKKEMIFSRCKSKNAAEFHCELFVSTLSGKRWMEPVRLEEPVNSSTATTTQPNLATLDGKTVLFFSSNRKGGEGGMDIWYSYRQDNGSYSEPVNAGKTVNTKDDEITPWFDAKLRTLYFSSSYHQSLGGFDIFKSEFKDNGFGIAVNAGYPINSGYNESYYSMNNSGTRVYLASNRPAGSENASSCCSDIYSFNIDTASPPPVVKIDTVGIFKDQMRLLVPLTLYFHNDEPNPRTKDTATSSSYEATYNSYFSMLPQYRKEYTKGLKGMDKENSLDDVEDFFRDSVETGFYELERFADLLEKVLRNGEVVKITMQGYCSPLASSDYNIRLAKRRISSLRNYFLSTRNGYFAAYLGPPSPGKGQILFENVDVGELPASKVSDDVRDVKNSVFSPFAASERKIQIIAVSFGKQ